MEKFIKLNSITRSTREAENKGRVDNYNLPRNKRTAPLQYTKTKPLLAKDRIIK
jgi:hypothetical protein